MFHKRNLQIVSAHHTHSTTTTPTRTIEWHFFLLFFPVFAIAHPCLCRSLRGSKIRLDTGRWQNCDDISVGRMNTAVCQNEQQQQQRNSMHTKNLNEYESCYLIMRARSGETLSDFSGGGGSGFPTTPQ